jgi:hypothetical protein
MLIKANALLRDAQAKSFHLFEIGRSFQLCSYHHLDQQVYMGCLSCFLLFAFCLFWYVVHGTWAMNLSLTSSAPPLPPLTPPVLFDIRLRCGFYSRDNLDVCRVPIERTDLCLCQSSDLAANLGPFPRET